MGRRTQLAPELINAISEVEDATKSATGGTLAVCLNYGGTYEIVDALKAAAKHSNPEELTPEVLAKYLYAPELPAVDIVVRTGGQHRISNFMLWRSAYSEFLFLDKYWPDVTKDDIDVILNDYASRSRRFGE